MSSLIHGGNGLRIAFVTVGTHSSRLEIKTSLKFLPCPFTLSVKKKIGAYQVSFAPMNKVIYKQDIKVFFHVLLVSKYTRSFKENFLIKRQTIKQFRTKTYYTVFE